MLSTNNYNSILAEHLIIKHRDIFSCIDYEYDV